tara:strand:+ start:492 stop:722 length:231 start_codon:yes stop_codon:yes gene_type:complete
MNNNKNEFKSFIVKIYGSQSKMAESLSVTPNTVNNWVHRNPLPLLKHTEKILKQCNTTAQELVAEVLFHNDVINEA